MVTRFIPVILVGVALKRAAGTAGDELAEHSAAKGPNVSSAAGGDQNSLPITAEPVPGTFGLYFCTVAAIFVPVATTNGCFTK